MCVTPGPVTVTILLVATFVRLCLRGLVSSPFHTLSAEVCRQEMFHLCCVSSFYSQCAETGVSALSSSSRMTSLEGTSTMYQGKGGVALVAFGPCLERFVRGWSGVELPWGLPMVG